MSEISGIAEAEVIGKIETPKIGRVMDKQTYDATVESITSDPKWANAKDWKELKLEYGDDMLALLKSDDVKILDSESLNYGRNYTLYTKENVISYLENSDLSPKELWVVLKNARNATEIEEYSQMIEGAKKLGLLNFNRLHSLAEWNDFFKSNPGCSSRMLAQAEDIFEMPTTDYVQSLGSYVHDEITKIEKSSDKPVMVLELAAGKGIISWHLGQDLREKGIQNKMVATDSKDWTTSKTTDFPVDDLDYKSALAKYSQDYNLIILVSWMPPNIDWMPDITADRSVQEVVLIGDSSSSGKDPETYDDKPGFDTVCLNKEGLVPQQISKASKEWPSETYVFKRTNSPV